jgi:hypothetical protein
MSNDNFFKKNVEKCNAIKTISLTKELRDFVEKNKINLSYFVREKLKELKEELNKNK